MGRQNHRMLAPAPSGDARLDMLRVCRGLPLSRRRRSAPAAATRSRAETTRTESREREAVGDAALWASVVQTPCHAPTMRKTFLHASRHTPMVLCPPGRNRPFVQRVATARRRLRGSNIVLGVRIRQARRPHDTSRTGASCKAHVHKYKTVGNSSDVSPQPHRRALC